MATVMTRKFKDEGGNVLFLRLVQGKRAYSVKVQHSEKGTGVLAKMPDEASGVDKLDSLADDAMKRGWAEVHRGGGLSEIPDPSDKPVRKQLREVRGGAKRSSSAR